MKPIKYLFIGALMLGFAAPVMAQNVESDVANISKVLTDAYLKDSVNVIINTKDQVKAFMKEYKKNAEGLAGLGRAYLDLAWRTKTPELNQKYAAEAQNYATQALTRGKNKCVDAFLLQGDIHAFNDDGGTAATWYQQAQSIDPKEPLGFIKYARVYRKISPEVSAQTLDKLRAERPDYPVDAVAAHFFYQADQTDKAFEHYSKANIGALTEDEIKEFALSGYMEGKNEKALEVAKYGLGKFPNNSVLNRMAFYNSLVAKDYDGALEFANKYLSLPDVTKTAYDFIQLGHVYMGKQQYDEAVNSFEQSIQLRESKDALKYLSSAYTKKGDYAKAIETFERYMTVAGSSKAEDYEALADIYTTIAADEATEEGAKKDAIRKAEQMYAKITEMSPETKFYWYKRAQMNMQLDPECKEGLAKASYDKLMELVNTGEESANDQVYKRRAYRFYAIYYYQKKDIASAKPWAEKLLAIDPSDAACQQIMKMK